MTIPFLDALRTTWQHLSTRNNWALVTNEESFLRYATEEMSNLQDLRSPEKQMRMALTRAYSALLYEQLRERNERAAHEIWLSSYRFALRDRFTTDEAEVLAQETVTLVLTKLNTLSSPTSFINWAFRVYQTARHWASHQKHEPILPINEDTEDIPDPRDSIEYINNALTLQILINLINSRLKNQIEVIVFARYILLKESALTAGSDLGLHPSHIRLVKSRLLKRLREDKDLISFLQELAGDSGIFEDDSQPRA